MDFSQVDNQTKTEFRASKIFIRAKELDDADENFKKVETNSIIDILYTPENLKLQIVSVDGGPDKLITKGIYELTLLLTEFFKIYIENPILKKTKKYGGKGVNDIILLIHVLRMPGTENIVFQEIEKNQSRINELGKTSGFKEIYLIFDFENKAICIYK